MEGHTENNISNEEKNRKTAAVAADMLIVGIATYPSTDYEVAAYLALEFRKKKLSSAELRNALTQDDEQIKRITTAANNRHNHARERNSHIPSELITDYDVRIVANTIFDIIDELANLSDDDVNSVLHHKFPGSEKLDKATLDDMRRMYVNELKVKKNE